MPAYRLYRLDGAGKITSALWVEAEGDDDAIRDARSEANGTRFELWEKQRLVARSDDPAAA